MTRSHHILVCFATSLGRHGQDIFFLLIRLLTDSILAVNHKTYNIVIVFRLSSSSSSPNLTCNGEVGMAPFR
jgi:hypothetical protein